MLTLNSINSNSGYIPSGSPAWCVTAANSSAVIGVSSDGFSTIVQPAASAGAIFQLLHTVTNIKSYSNEPFASV
jgi:hypothetical protein